MNKYRDKATISNTSFLSTLFVIKRDGRKRLSIRAKRWLVVIFAHLLFFLSFAFDMQILEGSLSGSRLLGFHLIDLFSSLELFAATYRMPVNVMIGSLTVAFVYLMLGGRSYCSWLCPYGLISEIGEKLHDSLVKRGLIGERDFGIRIRYLFWGGFLLLSLASGYLVFEVINVVGILSRFVVYGWSVALVWVFIVLLAEVFIARRAWCRYLCPIGTTYGFLGRISALRLKRNDSCDHCMVCHDVCFENQVLELTKSTYDGKDEYVLNGDCTLCGRCIDACHMDALSFDFRLKGAA